VHHVDSAAELFEEMFAIIRRVVAVPRAGRRFLMMTSWGGVIQGACSISRSGRADHDQAGGSRSTTLPWPEARPQGDGEEDKAGRGCPYDRAKSGMMESAPRAKATATPVVRARLMMT